LTFSFFENIFNIRGERKGMDKRRDSRIKKKVPIRYYFEGNAFLSFTGDLSRRGICIQTPRPCPAGRGINIEIEDNNPGRVHHLEQKRDGESGHAFARKHGRAAVELSKGRIPGSGKGFRLTPGP
jgi:hypothetical protein